MALRLRRLEDGEVLPRLPREAAVIWLALAFAAGVVVGAGAVLLAWATVDHMREDLKSMED